MTAPLAITRSPEHDFFNPILPDPFPIPLAYSLQLVMVLYFAVDLYCAPYFRLSLTLFVPQASCVIDISNV